MKKRKLKYILIGSSIGVVQPTIWMWFAAQPIPMERGPSFAIHILMSLCALIFGVLIGWAVAESME